MYLFSVYRVMLYLPLACKSVLHFWRGSSPTARIHLVQSIKPSHNAVGKTSHIIVITVGSLLSVFLAPHCESQPQRKPTVITSDFK